jgi:hypothetical protein
MPNCSPDVASAVDADLVDTRMKHASVLLLDLFTAPLKVTFASGR